jgi:hypothetical protein
MGETHAIATFFNLKRREGKGVAVRVELEKKGGIEQIYRSKKSS